MYVCVCVCVCVGVGVSVCVCGCMHACGGCRWVRVCVCAAAERNKSNKSKLALY